MQGSTYRGRETGLGLEPSLTQKRPPGILWEMIVRVVLLWD